MTQEGWKILSITFYSQISAVVSLSGLFSLFFMFCLDIFNIEHLVLNQITLLSHPEPFLSSFYLFWMNSHLHHADTSFSKATPFPFQLIYLEISAGLGNRLLSPLLLYICHLKSLPEKWCLGLVLQINCVFVAVQHHASSNIPTILSPFISFISLFNIIGIVAEAGKHMQQHNSKLFGSSCLPFPGLPFEM